MKTKKLLIMWMTSLFMLSISCKKETPTTIDNVKPKIQYTISGNGFRKVFYSDSIYNGQLNLPPNAKINISVSINDTSGLKHLEVQFPILFTFGSIVGLPTHTETLRGLSKFYSINKTIADPYTSFVISGDVTTPNVAQNEHIGADLVAYGFDFRPNTASVRIPIQITYTPIGGYGWLEY